MLLSLKWLKNYVDISDMSPIDLANKMTLAGIEVEKVYPLSEASNCVVGEVLNKRQHEAADKLSVCEVDLGTEVVTIVCGAENVAAGQKVVVAKIGATLPGGIKIKKAKLRGVESKGMICSLKELGIENKLVPQEFQAGIVVLDQKAEVGSDAISYLGLDDTILELSLTPNRSDCLSMYGIAYEVAALLDKEIKKPEGEAIPYQIDKDFKVTLKSEDCLLYYAKKIKAVKIKPSPQWLQTILMASGIRPINNVVDITNYVMLELGQPLHAFDLNKLDNQEIIVRNAHKGEEFETLDKIKRELIPSDLLITDGNKPIALAGVMGGHNSEIDDNTTDVLLESAIFKPLTVRNTYLRLNLRSESSLRFEKGIDSKRALYALNRAALLLVEIAGGKIDDTLSFSTNLKDSEKVIDISLEKINNVLGINLTKNDVSDCFRRLKFAYEVANNVFKVVAPSRRLDIEIEEDLIEEIIRIHGYENLNNTLPLTDTIGRLTKSQYKTRLIRRLLLASGLNEVITYSLTNEKSIEMFETDSKKIVKLLKPMSEDRFMMRTSLLSSLIEVASYNNARNIKDIFVFEIGKSYSISNNNPNETLLLSGLCTGEVSESKWQKQLTKVDFFYVKGILENIFEPLQILPMISFVQNKEIKNLHPERTANILLNNVEIGLVGQLHPKIQEEYDLHETYVFELNLDHVLGIEVNDIKYDMISKYPKVTRDIALVVDEKITAGSLVKAIKEQGNKILKSVEVFDVYQGEHVDKGKKSIAFSLVFENVEKTLTDEEVNTAYNRIVKYLENTYNAYLRK